MDGTTNSQWEDKLLSGKFCCIILALHTRLTLALSCHIQIKYVGTKLYHISEALLSSLSLEGDRDTAGPTFYFNLTELVPGTQYTVTVTAFNEAGEGMPSSPVVESTLVDGT